MGKVRPITQLGAAVADGRAMETLELHREGQMLAVFTTPDGPIEIGRALGCDISIDDPALAERHFLVMREGGTLRAYDVSRGRSGTSIHVPFDRMWPLGDKHALVRRQGLDGQESKSVVEDPTAPLSQPAICSARLVLTHGSRATAPGIILGTRPVHVGRDDANDLVLVDTAVSANHCRFERHFGSLRVRDLGSRNGTFVNGVRVDQARLLPGASLRVGRTELRVVETEGHGNPSSGGETGSRMVAASAVMLGLLGEARRLAELSWPVLVHGETGSGKEGIALALHEWGKRARGPFVTLNAGGVSRELVESELFGHERGAFTGAVSTHRGVFEQAQRGTLFLDEVGELPLAVQARLLRVLENGEVRRVGSETIRHVDVRLVCATHRDLCSMVKEGLFREDLYYRIARLVLEVPPLRARPADISVLAEHFLQEMADNVGPRRILPNAISRLQAYHWPGNVRELRNVLASAVALHGGEELDAAAVDDALLRRARSTQSLTLDPPELKHMVRLYDGNVAATARALGIPRTTLRDRLRSGEGY